MDTYTYVSKAELLGVAAGLIGGYLLGKKFGYTLWVALAGGAAGYFATRNMASDVIWDSTNGFSSFAAKPGASPSLGVSA